MQRRRIDRDLRPLREAAPPTELAEAPLALIIADADAAGGVLIAVLRAAGYRLRQVDTGREGIARARMIDPDAILVEATLPDMSGVDVCRGLAADPLVGATTPLIMLASASQDRRRCRVEALRAGAWDWVTLPADANELSVKLRTWTRARRAAHGSRRWSFRSRDGTP